MRRGKVVAVYPVIMCGGAGTRLWPASSAARPKQFIPLVGSRSSFQETAARVAPLADHGRVLVVAGVAHGALVEAQLAAIGAEAAVLLEPEPRDSAPAIAAACAWIAARDPEAVAVVVSADHHMSDPDAFRRAVAQTLDAARAGRIVTLGIRPTEPSSAYGYIRPGEAEGAVKPLEAFVEKPDAERARAYVEAGYLWNSGIFIARAATLLEELTAHAGAVADAARAAVETAGPDGVLGEAFRAAPKISIDYAVMEKTRRGAVLPAAFPWSDLGAWDAVWAASERDGQGNCLPDGAQAHGASELLVRAPPGVQVAVVGASRLAVVVEPDAVLVCGLDQSQSVKAVAAAARRPAAAGPRFASLAEARDWYSLWLRTAALPLWATLGVDPGNGGFREGLTPEGGLYDPKRRVRVQARQAFVYATAAAEGWDGPWLATAERGMAFLLAHGRRADGLFADVLTPQGGMADDTARLYEQAFVLLAFAALARAGSAALDCRAEAEALRGRLEGFRHPAGGFREAGERPFQANAQMHLFEAALAWEDAGGGPAWSGLADEIASLALARFMDPQSGALREFFDESWSAVTGEAGLVEPGHQFEWAWLLERWGSRRGDARARAAARGLHAAGRRGVDAAREVAVNSVWDDLSVRDAEARLWPQTERLKAAVALGEADDALSAARGLSRYLDVPVRGAWRDLMRADGGFAEGPAPASSFYHLLLAVLALRTA